MKNSLKNVLLAGAAWDFIGGIIFFMVHGVLHKQLTPAIYPFYSMVIGIFLFMLTYIQIISAVNIKRYVSSIGVVIFMRICYATTVLLYSILSELLPAQFFLIAVVDTTLVGLLVFFATKRERFTVRELFVPQQ